MRGEKDLESQEVCTKRCKRIFSNSLTLRQALMEIQKVKLSMRISFLEEVHLRCDDFFFSE
jgi:hypothetical protein